jgi:uncharacterized protein YigA (DUF484 family)
MVGGPDSANFRRGIRVMSGHKRRVAPRGAGSEESIAAYLRDNPDFFDRHPKLLEDLVIPHSCGGAVSLVEYQVSVLRDQVREMRRRMQSLADNARDNETLSRRLHQLTLVLVECTRLDEVLSNLYQAMCEDFSADFVAVRLFADPVADGDRGLGEFVGMESSHRELFSQVLVSAKPVCGHFKDTQLEFLFPEHANEIGSGALLPLGLNARFGLLAIGSRDPQRFHPGMGTMFLRQLGEIVSRILVPHVEAA